MHRFPEGCRFRGTAIRSCRACRQKRDDIDSNDSGTIIARAFRVHKQFVSDYPGNPI